MTSFKALLFIGIGRLVIDCSRISSVEVTWNITTVYLEIIISVSLALIVLNFKLHLIKFNYRIQIIVSAM